MNGKRAPSRSGGARPAGSPAVDALAPAGKKKVLKQLSGPDSAPSPPTRLWTANGAPKVLPPTRADMTSKALAETEPEEKPKKLKKKKGAEDSVCANMLAAGPAQPPGYHGDRRAQPRHHEITATIEMQRHRRRTDSDV